MKDKLTRKEIAKCFGCTPYQIWKFKTRRVKNKTAFPKPLADDYPCPPGRAFFDTEEIKIWAKENKIFFDETAI